MSESQGKAILIHGETGVGKTVLSIKKAPRPLLALDADNGLDSVIGVEGDDQVYVWRPPAGESELSWDDIDSFRNYVKAGEWDAQFKIIVADNLTALQKPIITHVIGEARARINDPKQLELRSEHTPTKQDWGEIYRIMDKWIRDVRDGGKRRGAHVIFTAGTRDWLDENAGYTKLFPNIEGAERSQIASHMDIVGYLEQEDGVRRLQLAPSGAIIAKVRLPADRHDRVPDEIIDPDFQKLMAEVKKGGGTPPPRQRKTTSKPTRIKK